LFLPSAKEETEMQDMAIHASTRLKQALVKSKETQAKLEEENASLKASLRLCLRLRCIVDHDIFMVPNIREDIILKFPQIGGFRNDKNHGISRLLCFILASKLQGVSKKIPCKAPRDEVH
jgi:hypothetical protein